MKHTHALKSGQSSDFNEYFHLSIYLLKSTFLCLSINITIDQLPHSHTWIPAKRGLKSLAYLVYKYIHWNIQGVSLSVYHGDESKSHAYIEPLTVASSMQNLGFFLCQLRQLFWLFTFACPAWHGITQKVS